MSNAFARAFTRRLPLFALCATSFTSAFAKDGTLHIASPWLRETASGQTAGGGFFSITNNAKSDDRLTGGTTPLAARVELHRMSMDGGVMRMRPLPNGLPVHAGQTVQLQPGGLHIMLIGLKRPLKRGESVPVMLSFARAGTIAVQFAVQPVTYAGGDHDHSH